ncbi:hypothetical protein Hypma_009024 [Hypsizygus marmoreus]|uniref:SET domain-containing protein n=1 Tax=Hypsizygus marmoreus TaxID=39966 RepID=A0A369JQE4_HYPMA|nr:hypothetical protein Hypma_009024 [Hypsizygus marmoreus]
MKPSREGYKPSYPAFIVVFTPGEFSSSLKAQKPFTVGEVMAPLEGLTKAPKAYTSVQCGPGPNDHIELNSDLVYINHSCDPNVAFDLSSPDSSDWHIRALKPLEKDTTLTYFYPSTEWDMDQPFKCECKSTNCLGNIQGAKYLSKAELDARIWINPWIKQLVADRDRKAPGS